VVVLPKCIVSRSLLKKLGYIPAHVHVRDHGRGHIGDYFRVCDRGRGHGHGRSDRALNGNDHATASGRGDLYG